MWHVRRVQRNESYDEGSCSALFWQVGDLTVICDSGASCHMSSSTGMMNYRESNAYVRTASGVRYPIAGYGDLHLTFRSSTGDVPMLLRIRMYQAWTTTFFL